MTGAMAAASLLAGAAVLVAGLPTGTAAAARVLSLGGLPAPSLPGSAPHGQPSYGVLPGSPASRADARGAPRLGGRRPARAACLLAGLGVLAVVPLPFGPVAAALATLAASLALHWLERLPDSRAAARAAVRAAADVPPALDLLAACLASGAPPADSLAVVAEVTPAPTGVALAAAARGLRLGVPPDDALAGLAGVPALGALADLLARSVTAGTASADAVRRLADAERARAGERARAAARRAGVLVVLPLGLCFLPAFVLLGVVPVVAGVAGRLLP